MSTKDDAGVDWGQVAQYVIHHRQRLGLSKGDAADKARVSPVTWRKLEAGEGPFREPTLFRVAWALGCPPGELLKLAGLPYEDKSPVRTKRGKATAESISSDPALDPADKRLLAQLYERLSRPDHA
jgi:transcriptional regulator with XRE-family HTH domain